MHTSPRAYHQRIARYFLFFVAGVVGLGAILDALVNAISIVTPNTTYLGSALLVGLWAAVEIMLRLRGLEWSVAPGQRFRVRRLGPGSRAWLAGVLFLLWVPRLSDQSPSSSEPYIFAGYSMELERTSSRVVGQSVITEYYAEDVLNRCVGVGGRVTGPRRILMPTPRTAALVTRVILVNRGGQDAKSILIRFGIHAGHTDSTYTVVSPNTVLLRNQKTLRYGIHTDVAEIAAVPQGQTVVVAHVAELDSLAVDKFLDPDGLTVKTPGIQFPPDALVDSVFAQLTTWDATERESLLHGNRLFVHAPLDFQTVPRQVEPKHSTSTQPVTLEWKVNRQFGPMGCSGYISPWPEPTSKVSDSAQENR